jgi:hypothetical protein
MFAASPAIPQKAWESEEFELVNSLTIGKLPLGAGAKG